MSVSPVRRIERLCVLICAYNEEERIQEVVRGALVQQPFKVVVVDDGSIDDTALLARQAGAEVLRNPRNFGKGESLKRGFNHARYLKCDAVIVVDSDGQHDPYEIGRFLDAYHRTGIPVLIGNRMADTAGMPHMRRWTNYFMAWVLNRLVRIYLPDPPCGYRFYRMDVLPFITSEEGRFAFEFDVLLHAARRNIRIDSVRISTIYFKHGRSHVAPLRDAWLLFKVVQRQWFMGRRKRRDSLAEQQAV